MRWFGTSWGAPVNEYCEHAETPVGENCFDCGRAILETDAGFLIPHFEYSGSLRSPHTFTEHPHHRKCFLRTIVAPPKRTGN